MIGQARHMLKIDVLAYNSGRIFGALPKVADQFVTIRVLHVGAMLAPSYSFMLLRSTAAGIRNTSANH